MLFLGLFLLEGHIYGESRHRKKNLSAGLLPEWPYGWSWALRKLGSRSFFSGLLCHSFGLSQLFSWHSRELNRKWSIWNMDWYPYGSCCLQGECLATRLFSQVLLPDFFFLTFLLPIKTPLQCWTVSVFWRVSLCWFILLCWSFNSNVVAFWQVFILKWHHGLMRVPSICRCTHWRNILSNLEWLYTC